MKQFFKSLIVLSSVVAMGTPALGSEIDISVLIPEWKPNVERSAEGLGKKCHAYLNHNKTIVVFSHGTCVLVDDDLSDAEILKQAKFQMSGFLKFHPDMIPVPMKDGNLVVQAPHINAFSIVTKADMEDHSELIKANHLKAIPSHEVLITPQGQNVFDELGMTALFGRAFIFWDAQDLVPVTIHRIIIDKEKE